MSGTPRYFVAKPAAGGGERYYWQPAKSLRDRGWRTERLPDDRAAAMEKADGLNAQIDAWRLDLADAPPAESKAAQQGAEATVFVYVISRDDGIVKIGYSKNPLKRVQALQNGSANRLQLYFLIAAPIDLARRVESEAHRMLRDNRLVGEWFNVSAERAAHIAHQCHKALRAGTNGDQSWTVCPTLTTTKSPAAR